MVLSFSFNNSILFFRASLVLFRLGIFLRWFCKPTDSIEVMKVHPALKKRNITFSYDINSSLAEVNRLMGGRQKKLQRLPHIFSKVLELPFRSDADVRIEEDSDCFRFIVITDDVGDDVIAHTIDIHPGLTKIVIGGSNLLEFFLDELEVDLWSIRLPPSTRPELANAVYVDGELIVTVPKGASSDQSGGASEEEEEEEEGGWVDGNGDLRGGVGRVVLVQ